MVDVLAVSNSEVLRPCSKIPFAEIIRFQSISPLSSINKPFLVNPRLILCFALFLPHSSQWPMTMYGNPTVSLLISSFCMPAHPAPLLPAPHHTTPLYHLSSPFP